MKKRSISMIVLASMMITTMSVKDVGAIDYLGYAKSALWYIARYAANTFYTTSPVIASGYNYVTSSTGTKKFNSGSVGASVKVTTYLGKSNMSLEAFAKSSPFLPFEKLSIILTNPSNNDVINKTVTNSQLVYFSSKAPYGKYTLRFVDQDSTSWDCYYNLFDWDKKKPNPNYRTVSTVEGTPINCEVDEVNERIYLKSSDNFETKASVSKSQILSFEGMGQQFYDEKLGANVDKLKEYNVGDSLYMSDKVYEIEYDANEHATSIMFLGDGTIGTWKFSGNLLNRFKKGDTLNFKFLVVEQFGNFENINYVADSLSIAGRGYADIDDYLIQ